MIRRQPTFWILGGLLLATAYFFWNVVFLPRTLDLDQVFYWMRGRYPSPAQLHPHHILHDSLNYFVYKLIRLAGFYGSPMEFFKLKNLLFASALIYLVFRFLGREVGRPVTVIFITIGLAVSHSFNFYATANDTPMVPLFFAFLLFTTLSRDPSSVKKPAPWFGELSLVFRKLGRFFGAALSFALCVLFHQTKVMLAPVIALLLYRRRQSPAWYFFKYVLLVAMAGGLVLTIYVAAGQAKDKSFATHNDFTPVVTDPDKPSDNFYHWLILFSHHYTPLRNHERKWREANISVQDSFVASEVPYTFKRKFLRTDKTGFDRLYLYWFWFVALAAFLLFKYWGSRRFIRFAALYLWFALEFILGYWWEAHHFEFFVGANFTNWLLGAFVLAEIKPERLRLPMLRLAGTYGAAVFFVFFTGGLFYYNFSVAVAPRHFLPIHGYKSYRVSWEQLNDLDEKRVFNATPWDTKISAALGFDIEPYRKLNPRFFNLDPNEGKSLKDKENQTENNTPGQGPSKDTKTNPPAPGKP